MAICPFAIQRLIPPGSNDPAIKPRTAVLHVAVSTADSLFDFFRFRSGGIESHFYIRLTGKIEQYRDTDFEADAQYAANPFAISIETAGLAGGKWNYLQRRAIKRLLKWLHETHGIAYRPPARWDSGGIGYHSQFPEWNTSVHSCPGPARIKQYNDWLLPWLKSLRTDTPVEAFRKEVRAALLKADPLVPDSRPAARRMLDDIRQSLSDGPRR